VTFAVRRAALLFGLAALCAGAVACANQLHAMKALVTGEVDRAAANAIATFPPGDEGSLIRYGHDLIADTPRYAGQYITSRMSCAACHPKAGTVAREGSLLGTYARFPQWNRRAHRFIALQDRLAECFLYSMNGHPPAYYSREMIAMTAYIAWLSRGSNIGIGFDNQDPKKVNAPSAPDAANGAKVYVARCASCHGADGNGKGLAMPPLWGPASFNDKAGMNRMDRIAPFVRTAMPQDAPGTLTDQEATDVSAYILARPRPHFDKSKLIRFPDEKAGYF
jgi:thiosulfate dehydrogenase